VVFYTDYTMTKNRQRSPEDVTALEEKARWVRRKSFEMAIAAGRGHLGGAFSATEILVALYYGGVLDNSPARMRDDDRDHFLFSKGHSCLSFYCVLADRGFFDITTLDTYGKNGTILGGHPDHLIPGVEAISGSLGHGLGIGCGLALAAKLKKQKSRTFVLLGDGECNEGSVWEAVSFAPRRGLGNLITILDHNKVGATGFVADSSDGNQMEKKWESFGWEVCSVNGHNFDELLPALAEAHTRNSEKPLAIIAHTIKGKGVSFMENDYHWHHGIPAGELLAKAREELGIEHE
jgi:transketolase